MSTPARRAVPAGPATTPPKTVGVPGRAPWPAARWSRSPAWPARGSAPAPGARGRPRACAAPAGGQSRHQRQGEGEVLPEPVRPRPSTSRPARVSGSVSVWMGNGVVMPCAVRRRRGRGDAQLGQLAAWTAGAAGAGVPAAATTGVVVGLATGVGRPASERPPRERLRRRGGREEEPASERAAVFTVMKGISPEGLSERPSCWSRSAPRSGGRNGTDLAAPRERPGAVVRHRDSSVGDAIRMGDNGARTRCRGRASGLDGEDRVRGGQQDPARRAAQDELCPRWNGGGARSRSGRPRSRSPPRPGPRPRRATSGAGAARPGRPAPRSSASSSATPSGVANRSSTRASPGLVFTTTSRTPRTRASATPASSAARPTGPGT